MSVAFLSSLYLLLLWGVSSLLRGKGIVVFTLGALLLAATLIALRAGRRTYFVRLCFGMVMAAATVAGIETALWVAPGLLSGRLANVALSRYHLRWDGIYDNDLHEGEIMRPDLSRRMYWNGHWWNHRTNHRGFRGPEVDRADVIVLGDSMIYGHGVEQDQTVPAQLEALSGCVTANLGRQGASMIQALLILRRLGPALSPRIVVVCSHPNDPADAVERYAEPELRRFIEEEGYAPRAIQPDPSQQSIFDWWYLHVALPMRSARVLHALMRRPSTIPEPTADASGGPYVPSQEEIQAPFRLDTPERKLGWEAHVRALREIKRTAEAWGGRVVLMDLGYPRELRQAVRQVADEMGVPYSHAGRAALEHALAGEPIYLPRDGHWTPQGSRVVAGALAETIGRCAR